ncbi:MAG: UDP-N-acetylmuramate dehydrogenase [Calditrichaeota bacterium]|nr:UDP-N-acetylmuramate dehydrogenase [Calditrichota bacterium]
MDTIEALAAELTSRVRGKIKIREPFARHTSYRVGGPADIFVVPSSRDSLREVLKWTQEKRLPVFVLGKGTNLLVSDSGFRGVVVYLGTCCKDWKQDGTRVTIGSGWPLKKALERLADEGLSGYEKIYGIPGTVGGALHMNAGAFGTEIADHLVWVEIMDLSGEIHRISREDLGFGYRRGIVNPEWIILSGTFELEKDNPKKIRQSMNEVLERRRKKQPLSRASAGSVFKRPPGHYAGALIQEAGLKGFRHGRALVSRKHANFIINAGGATASEIKELIEIVRSRVFQKSGIHLELENELVGW